LATESVDEIFGVGIEADRLLDSTVDEQPTREKIDKNKNKKGINFILLIYAL
jgi:hypothetical protein